MVPNGWESVETGHVYLYAKTLELAQQYELHFYDIGFLALC